MTRSPHESITSDEIEKVFEQCPECGKHVVCMSDAHYCDRIKYRPDPSKQERQQRINADPYPGEEHVLVIDQPSSGAYAYHEIDAEGTPVCAFATDDPLVTLTREHAHDQHAPCQRCQRIRHTREREADQ